MRRSLVCMLALYVCAAAFAAPSISRVDPLGGQRGTLAEIEIAGAHLSNAQTVEFDCRDLAWERTIHASSARLRGLVRIAPDAPLGPHLLRVKSPEGYSTTAMFNVVQLPSVAEAEPNGQISEAQQISGRPLIVQGILDGAPDIDVFAIQARAGERWVFDMRSIEYGSAVEAKMLLLDAHGKRVVFNDDRDDFLETPFIEHTFAQDGTYYLKLDQYRGPRGFNFGKNATYMLRISSMPTIWHIAPLGARTGETARVTLHGSGLDSVEEVYLTQARAAEYERMTYPFTMPIHFRRDPPTAKDLPRIAGEIISRTAQSAEAVFPIPEDAEEGLWKVWAAGKSGIADGPLFELSRLAEYSESNASEADWQRGPYAVNGALASPKEEDVYAVHVHAGEPLHFWTVTTQLGAPHIDPVLTLRDSEGKRIAENDDVVAGQGTLIGNPDSSLFYTPEKDGVLFLCIKDRTRRGGPSYQYRLKVKIERPSFQLFTTPENLTVQEGGEAQIKVHLIREAGFEGEVSIWFDGLPEGVEAPRGKFRADQLFEPNADGADMIIPDISFTLAVPETLPAGTYPFRVFGAPTSEESSPERRVVEAQSTMIMGPLLDAWNFVRRPLPQVAMTVVEPFDAGLSSKTPILSLSRGSSATLELEATNLPEQAEIHLKDLPAGISFAVTGRQENQITLQLDATREAPLGKYEFSAEARVGGRWAPTGPIQLAVEQPEEISAGR